MKNVYLFVFFMVFLCFTQGHCQTTPDKDDLTENTEDASKIPSQEDIERFILNGWVCYSDFGAKGDGKTDDIEPIAATHTFANKYNLTVKGDDKATYYIGGRKHTVNIMTDTDFGTADKNTPILWDFDRITEFTVIPVDETILTITGGKFTTIANREDSKYNYYARGIAIRRSNVVVDGLEHRITGEGDQGAPYNGFISIANCSNVTVRNTLLTGHKVYRTIGSAGVPVSMGTYDININKALNITFENCSQTNDIHNAAYWGIMGSNYCKNLVYDHCTFSRFDAHMGVANAAIRNSTLGHQGINAIGCGVLVLENSTVNATNLINLRSDYGSTWEGEFFIRDCVFVPRGAKSGNVNLIGGSNSGQHDFGYTCYMPERITIENLKIDDAGHPAGYKGPAIFSDFNPEMKDETYLEKFPYITTKEVILKNVTIESGLPLRISDNTYMFKDVKIINE